MTEIGFRLSAGSGWLLVPKERQGGGGVSVCTYLILYSKHNTDFFLVFLRGPRNAQKPEKKKDFLEICRKLFCVVFKLPSPRNAQKPNKEQLKQKTYWRRCPLVCRYFFFAAPRGSSEKKCRCWECFSVFPWPRSASNHGVLYISCDCVIFWFLGVFLLPLPRNLGETPKNAREGEKPVVSGERKCEPDLWSDWPQLAAGSWLVSSEVGKLVLMRSWKLNLMVNAKL
jgi:hypothetical protein